MEKQRLSLRFSSAIENITSVNSSFDKGVMRIFYFGRNRNNSFISKDALIASEATLDYCPIVANYNVEEDSIGGHDIELVHTDNGIRMINATSPVGVVPAGAKHWFETIHDESGDHEYFCSEVLLWKRQPAYQKLIADGITAQSMEITVNDGAMEDGVYVIKNFEFTALTLLNGIDDVPCFESAGLQMFAFDSFKEQYSLMIEELKGHIADFEKTTKGGTNSLEEKNNLLTEYSVDPETIDFNIDDYTLEELKAKLEEMKKDSFALTAGQLEEELRNALSEEKVETDWGKCCRYWYMDHTETEVYFEDTNDWNIYGASFTMNGDHVVIDFAGCKRKKISYVDFDEGDYAFSFKECAEAFVGAALEKAESKFSEERTALNQKYEALEHEANELKSFKDERLASDRANAENAVFEMFSDKLAGVEEFDALRNDCASMSIEEIEDRCYAILGRRNAKFSFTQNPPPKIPVERTAGGEKEPYGGLFVKYGNQ